MMSKANGIQAGDAVGVGTGRGDGTAVVVLLHGRGGTVQDMAAIAAQLPNGPEYVALRAPISEPIGHSWFQNRGIGRPDSASLGRTIEWFTDWLDAMTDGRDVILVGYSGGATFAGALVLDDPARYVGAALVNGLIPFDAGFPANPGRLGGLTIMVANGDADPVVPHELVASTWDYLNGPSAAPTLAYRTPGGHEFPGALLGETGAWITRRFAFVAHRRHELVDPDTIDNHWSEISVPGARAFMLDGRERGPHESFIVPSVGEFAHLHPARDGSMHMALPARVAVEVVAKGWGVAHPLSGTQLAAGMILVYGPRTDAELDVVRTILMRSHHFASRSVHSDESDACPVVG